MVGVPGRSRGCNTCIRRKIRCDQQTPLCGTCRKSNRICTGYKRRLGYVLSADMSVNLAASGREENTVTYQGRWRRAESPQPSPAEPSRIWEDNSHSLSLSRQVSATTAFREQLHYIYLDSSLPAELLNSRPKDIVTRNWLLQLQELAIRSPALETSVAAFFAAEVGRKNSDIILVHQSRSMYVSGLQQFQQALRNLQTRLSDETLTACMALSLYELMESPSGNQNAYMTHQRGAMTLLQLRGPDASASPLGQSLFLSLRAQTGVRVGISLHPGETFLSRPEWIERPWKLLSKTPLDELMGHLFESHAAYQQYNKVFHKTDQMALQNGFRDVIAKGLNVDSALGALYGGFEKSVSGLLYWPEFSTLESPLDNAQLGKVFPVSFHFPVVCVAQFIVTYWAGMIAVHFLLMETYDQLTAIESPTAPSVSLPTPADGSFHSAVQSREDSNTWRTMGAKYLPLGRVLFAGSDRVPWTATHLHGIAWMQELS